MIIYIFNHPFPAKSGFTNRCLKQLEQLVTLDKVVIVCRNSGTEPKKEIAELGGKTVPLFRFGAPVKHMERVERGYASGWYEIIRNLALVSGFTTTLLKALFSAKGNKRLCVVASPLTIPLYSFFIGKLTFASMEVLELHDLEPETAKDIKNLSDSSLVMKIEYFLEWFLSHAYKKVIVTSESQKKRLVQRAKLSAEKVFILPNLVPTPNLSQYSRSQVQKKYNIASKEFVIGYSSNLTYNYTIAGLAKLIKNFQALLQKAPLCKLIIAGDGDGLPVLQQITKEVGKELPITFTGRIPDVNELLSVTDIAIIPWEKNVMTEIILPTKLLEYMAAGKAIIAPNFGEFNMQLEHKKTALLYSNSEELQDMIIELYNNAELRKTLGQNAQQLYTEKFNSEDWNAKYTAFITKP